MDKEEIMLKEYEVCQQDNTENWQGYWTLAAIFIGISSALLAGLIYGFMANDSLFRGVLFHYNCKIVSVGIIALVLASANIIILKKLRGWHKRMLQNQKINLGRMREIELELGMSRWWRFPAVDGWYEILKNNPDIEKECDQNKWSALIKELKRGNPYFINNPKYEKKLNSMKQEILQFAPIIKKKDYERPHSRWHFPWILYTMIHLWGLVIFTAILAITSAFICWQWSLIVDIVIISAFHIICRIIRKCRSKS